MTEGGRMDHPARKRLLGIGECMIELAPSGVSRTYTQGFAGDVFNTLWYATRCLDPDWQVQFYTALGQDDFSDDLLAFAESAGISCKAVPRLKGVMPGLYMIRLHQGERGFSYWRGQSAARLMMQDVDLVARQVQEADVIYVSGITLAILPPEGRSALIAVMAAARKASKFVVFDPNIRPALWEDATTLCATLMTVAPTSSLVLPSFDDEMAAFGDLGPEETVARYRSAGAGQVVVKNGPAAVVTWDGANLARHETPILPGPLIDSTAAGDSFNAAFLAQILRSDEIASAVRAGQALASRVVQGRGALIETPRIITGVDR